MLMCFLIEVFWSFDSWMRIVDIIPSLKPTPVVHLRSSCYKRACRVHHSPATKGAEKSISVVCSTKFTMLWALIGKLQQICVHHGRGDRVLLAGFCVGAAGEG